LVATGPGKPWNFVLKKSGPWKVLENALGPGKSWNSHIQVLENPGNMVARSWFFSNPNCYIKLLAC